MLAVPTYSYACTECDNRFDAVQAFSDDALTTCPQCSGKLRKLFNSVGVVFKGSGFYRNDSRAVSSNGSADSSSESSSEKPAAGDSSKTASTEDKSSGDSKPKNDGKADKKSTAAPATTTAS